MSLSQEHLETTSVAMRISTALSIAGIFVIFGFFSFSKIFSSPIHRIIFITSFFDLFSCVATLISISGPTAGNNSPVCQFQGFVLEMFPLADVLWTLVMAVDVYLATFHHFESRALQKLEIPYIATITVITFIPALVLLFIRTTAKGPIYGSAVIWCTIAPNWTLVRLLLFYVPIWSAIAVIFIIYCLVGTKIWMIRSGIEFSSKSFGHFTSASAASQPSHGATSTTFRTLDEVVHVPSPQQDTDELFVEQTSTLPQSTQAQLESSRQQHLFKQFLLIPLLFFVALLSTWIAPTIYRAHLFHHPMYSSYLLLLTISILFPLRGFWNSVIFVTIGMREWRRLDRERAYARSAR